MKRKLLFVLAPLAVIATAAPVFYLAARLWGQYAGFLLGMSFYWLVGCVAVSWLVSKEGPWQLFRSERPLLLVENWWVILLFSSTLIAPLLIYDTVHNLFVKPPLLILLVVPLATVNGCCEELFWRGLFIKEFPHSVTWGVLVPTALFSVWHLAPQLAFPHARPLGFVLSTLPFGLVYGAVAFKTKSAKWSAIGHSISGILAFAGSSGVSAYQLWVR